MSNFRDDLSDPGLICAYNYWTSLRGGRRMPARRNIDPLQIPRGYLPNIMLIDILHERHRDRYRLGGTSVVSATSEDRTGRFFDEVRFFREHPAVMPQVDAVVRTSQPLYSLEPITNFTTGSTYEVDRLLLPLSDDDRLVDTLLVLFQFNTGPTWSGFPCWVAYMRQYRSFCDERGDRCTEAHVIEMAELNACTSIRADRLRR